MPGDTPFDAALAALDVEPRHDAARMVTTYDILGLDAARAAHRAEVDAVCDLLRQANVFLALLTELGAVNDLRDRIKAVIAPQAGTSVERGGAANPTPTGSTPVKAPTTKPARIVALPMQGSSLTYGKTYDVIRWDDSDVAPRRYPVVICDLGHEYRLTETKWEAAPSPAATPAAWVPSVGDVVHYVTDEPGSRDRVVVGVDALGQMTMREVRYPNSFSYGTDVEKFWRYIGPATSAERAAAGLPPADTVDREGLADAIRRSRAGGATMTEWSRLDVYDRKHFLDYADAAIAYFAARGVKS